MLKAVQNQNQKLLTYGGKFEILKFFEKPPGVTNVWWGVQLFQELKR